MAKRSMPGEGQPVALYMLAPEIWADEVVRAFGKTAMCACAGEDYANSVWPVIVKVKPEVHPRLLAQHLRDLAEAVESGFFVDLLDKELTGNLGKDPETGLNMTFTTPEFGRAGPKAKG